MKKVKGIKLPKWNLPLPKIKEPRLPKMSIRKDFAFAVMAYIPVLVLVSYFFKKKNYFVEYHVKQGLALLVVEVLFSFSFYIPVLPYLFAIAIVILFIIGIVNILLRKEKALPIIGKWAENINL